MCVCVCVCTQSLLDLYGTSDRPQRRTALIAAELSRYNIDIAALSETRLLDEGSITRFYIPGRDGLYFLLERFPFRWTTWTRVTCNRLGNTEARNEFRHLLDEKLGESEPCLSSENTIEQQWTYISSVLYDAAAQSIGYKSRNHQDWFDDNSDAIHNLLKDMHKALDLKKT